MVMAVEGLAHAQAARQRIYSTPAMPMNTRSFVRYEHIGASGHETDIVHRKNRTAVLAHQSISPEVAAANKPHQIAW